MAKGEDGDMSKDEDEAAKAWKDYHDNGIVKYNLDDIAEYNSTKEHMQAAFFTGFYAGRNYQRDKLVDKAVIDKARLAAHKALVEP